MRIAVFVLLACGFTLFQMGCGGETAKPKGKKSAKKHDDHSGHEHGDHIGGNNPHKIELKDAPFNAKWAHAGDLVTITIVDNEYKKEITIAASELVVSDPKGKNTFKLPPLKKNEKGEASVFELEDEKLEMIMDHKPTLSVKVGEKTYKTTIIHMH